MKRPLTAATLMVVVLALGVGIYGVTHGGGTAIAVGTTVGFDMDATGNDATTVGSIELCGSVANGEQFVVDVFVDEIPAGSTFSGFNYRINFDDTRVRLITQDHNLLLGSAAGSNVFDLSDAVPDGISPHIVGAGDFGTAEVGPVKGLLGRYTLEALPSAPAGAFSLTFTDLSLNDAAGDIITVSQVLDGSAVPQAGVIAVNQACPVDGADLTITKTDSPDPVQAGDPLTYSLSIINQGPFDATNVVATDTLPPDVTFATATPSQGTCSDLAGTVTCAVGNMSAGATATVSINVTVNSGASGTITNNASVTSDVTDPDASNNSDTQSTFVGTLADLVITKTDSADPVRIGDPLTYTLLTTNNGPSDALNVVVTDTLPPQATFVSAAASVGTCSNVAGTVTCNLGTIATGTSASITIDVTADSTVSELITNTASVTSDVIDPDTANNSASEGTFVRTDQIVTVVGVDTNPSQTPANTATSLGSIETCFSVSPGATFEVDIFVDEIPTGRDFGGFNYRINFDDTRVAVTGQNHIFLLASAPGSSLLEFNEGVPDSISPHTVGVGDLGTAEVGPASGVLGRYTFSVLPGAPSGTFSLTLSDIELSDSSAATIPIDQLQAGTIAVGEPCPADTDADGIPDTADNCPTSFNPDQANFDGDALGDACDPDVDEDGLANAADLCSFTPLGEIVDANGCSDSQVDQDGDGVCDPSAPSNGPSGCTGTDNCPSAVNPLQEDFDGDGLGDACDTDVDGDGLLNPDEPPGCDFNSDCDGDGVSDGFLDPDGPGVIVAGPDNCITTPNPTQSDLDGDGLGDACDPDIDGDGILNAADQCPSIQEDIDTIDDTDGCPEIDSQIISTSAEASFIVPQNVDDPHNATVTVRNNGNLTLDLELIQVLRSTVGGCEARWVADALHGDSVFDAVVGTSLISQLEHVDAAVAPGESRTSTHTYIAHCFQSPGFFDNALKLETGVVPVAPAREDSGAGGDNARLQFVDVTVGNAADVQKVSLIVPAVPLQVGVPQAITVSSVLRNNGPFGPVDVIDHLTAFAPADCSVTPPSTDTAASLPVTGPLNPDTTLNNVFTLQCNAPSFHTFTFANQVDVIQLDVADPDPSNNSISTQATFAVFADADLAVASASVAAPVSQPADTPFTVTVSASVQNNGLLTPVDADATFDLSLPPDCSKTPNTPQTEPNVSLATGIPTAVQKGWQVTCSQPSFHQYSGTVSIAAVDQHIADSVPANDSSTGLFDGSITTDSDVRTSAPTSDRDDLPSVPGTQVLIGPLPPINPLPESETFTLNELLNNDGPFGPVSVDVTHSVTDVPLVCTVTPNPITSPLSLPVATSTPQAQLFTTQWLDDPAPPLFCTITINSSVSVTSAHVSDPNTLNNSSQITLDIVRDSDADGVPDDYTAKGGPRDNCPQDSNPDQSDLDGDGVGDVCDSGANHDIVTSSCTTFGPPPITVSDIEGSFMFVQCEIENDSDAGGTLPGQPETVTVSLSVTGFPTTCGPTPTFPNSGVQIILVSPGTSTFVLLANETRSVIHRVRFECHEPTVPDVYAIAVPFTMDQVDTGGGSETPQQTANNNITKQKNVIIAAPQEPTAADITLATNINTPLLITLSGSDVGTCELTFAVSGPSNGSLSPITNSACTPGTPNADSATVTFTPDPGVCSPSQGSFTYTADDGIFISSPATVSIAISCVP